MTYSLVFADPPWSYKQRWGDMEKHGAATSHYSTMSQAEIQALPVGEWAADNAALLLWGTWPKIDEALAVCSAWGFRFVTCAFVWNKTYKNGRPYCGLGFYTRSGSEFVLLGIKGSMKPASRSVRQVITAPVGRHSAKPQVFYDRARDLFPEGPRLEMFARGPRDGWDVWGNEC